MKAAFSLGCVMLSMVALVVIFVSILFVTALFGAGVIMWEEKTLLFDKHQVHRKTSWLDF